MWLCVILLLKLLRRLFLWLVVFIEIYASVYFGLREGIWVILEKMQEKLVTFGNGK